MLSLYLLLIAEPPGEPCNLLACYRCLSAEFIPKTGNTKSHSKIPISIAFAH
jgi:hypothetical protein